MVIHQPHGLHEGIAYNRSHKGEARPFQLPAHFYGKLGLRRNVFGPFPFVDQGPAIHKRPDIAGKTSKAAGRVEKGAGILDGGLDFKAVSNNSGIGQKDLNILPCES